MGIKTNLLQNNNYYESHLHSNVQAWDIEWLKHNFWKQMKHDKHHCCPSQHRHTREVNMFEKGTVIKPS